MVFTGVRSALAVLILVSVPLSTSWAMPKETHDADSAAIQKLFTDFNEAFNNHDAHAVAMLFTDDSDFVTIGAAKFHGPAAIEQHLTPLFSVRAKTIHREAGTPEIHFLTPDMATVDSDTVTSGILGPNGAAAPPVKGFYDWIVMKQKGRWLIAVWHESNISTATGQPPAVVPAH